MSSIATGCFFAVPMDFPKELIPESVGLIVADRFEAAILRMPEEQKLSAARRKKLLISFGQTAAGRLGNTIGDNVFMP